MTISRGQMNRQLYMGGGIMNAVPRQGYFLGKIVKGVGKALDRVEVRPCHTNGLELLIGKAAVVEVRLVGQGWTKLTKGHGA